MTHQHADFITPTLTFVEHTLLNYSTAVVPYMQAAYLLTQSYLHKHHDLDTTLTALARLDWHHHTLLLNHVARRASMIQGMALLSLYMRSFSETNAVYADASQALMEQLRKGIRRGGAQLQGGALSLSPPALAGHLPTCIGAFSCCIGLSMERMVHLNLFLQARNLMSCSIRLNTLGPYMSHQLLARPLRGMVEQCMKTTSRLAADKLYTQSLPPKAPTTATTPHAAWDDWDWDDEEPDAGDIEYACTTWPLGEIVQARHDQLHSRLFNS